MDLSLRADKGARRGSGGGGVHIRGPELLDYGVYD